MSEFHYLGERSEDAFERERLGLLTELMDPITRRRLDALPIEPGWRCLDVGAGNGSVARDLARRVGDRGQVVAADINPRFLGDIPGVEARRLDIQSDALEEGHYDLAHCRALLVHLASPEKALARMAAALRPGGWLLIEEPDVTSYGAADASHPMAERYDRCMGALIRGLLSARIADGYLGRRALALVEKLGLEDVAAEGATWSNRGGGTGGRFMRMSLELLREPLVSTGALSDDDYAWLLAAQDEPSFSFIDMTLWGVRGRRPA